PRKAPVALRLEVAQEQLLLQAELDRGNGVRDLAGHELLAAAGGVVDPAVPDARMEGAGLRFQVEDPPPFERGLRLDNLRERTAEVGSLVPDRGRTVQVDLVVDRPVAILGAMDGPLLQGGGNQPPKSLGQAGGVGLEALEKVIPVACPEAVAFVVPLEERPPAGLVRVQNAIGDLLRASPRIKLEA